MKILNEKGVIHFANSGAPADKEGYLMKKGEVNKGFQKRWFVLKGNLLFYYEKKFESEPLGVIVLEGCTIELAEDSDNFMFMINFASNGLRTYCLSAHSQEMMESWMKALSCAGYEYVKLMVWDLQCKLDEVMSNSGVELIQAADRDSKIFSPTSKDDASLASSGSRGSDTSSLTPSKVRVNPFNDPANNAEPVDPGDAFRPMTQISTKEVITWGILQCDTFAEMHELMRHQIVEQSAK